MQRIIIAVAMLVATTISAFPQTDRNTITIECSRKADELRLQGTERRDFRTKCKEEAQAAAAKSEPTKSALQAKKKQTSGSLEERQLRSGIYVARDVSCDSGSNADTLRVRGAMIYGRRSCGVIVTPPGASILRMRECVAESSEVGPDQAQTLIFTSSTQFVYKNGTDETTFRYCEADSTMQTIYVYNAATNTVAQAKVNTAAAPAQPEPRRVMGIVECNHQGDVIGGAPSDRFPYYGPVLTLNASDMDDQSVWLDYSKLLRLATILGLTQVKTECNGKTSFGLVVRTTRSIYGVTTPNSIGLFAMIALDKQAPLDIRVNYIQQDIEARQQRMQQEEQQRRLAEIRRQQAAQEEIARQQRNEPRRVLRVDFGKRTGVQDLVRMDELKANPFLYKGKTVAVLTSFQQMLSENEAVFMQYGFVATPGLYVSNVPSTRFRQNQQMVLAFKVIGIKKELALPHGEYVGEYFCKEQDCKEFFDQ